MTSNNNGSTKGFTLIELVVSLMIMAMVSAAVLSGLRTGLLVWDKENKHIEDLRRSRVVVQLLHDAIAGALPFSYATRVGGTPVQKLAFEAAPDRIRFVTRTSFKDGPDSLPRWMEIRWVKEAEKQTGDILVEERIIMPPDNSPDTTAYWSGKVLSANSCSFDFMENATDRPIAWARDWRPLSDQLPRAVRIRCTYPSKEVSSVVPLDYAASYAAGLRLN